ncbi:protein of unknown function [Streptomyces murinus]
MRFVFNPLHTITHRMTTGVPMIATIRGGRPAPQRRLTGGPKKTNCLAL